VELDGDPHHLLAPLAERLTELSRERRYEEAAAVRDDAERLRRLLARRRQVEALRAAGRVVLRIDEKVTVELEDGLVIGCRESDRTGAPNAAPGVDPLATVDGDDRERITVAEWIDSYRRHIRVLWVQSDHGISMPSARIPMLTELCELGGQSVTAGRFGSAA
jgi:FAD/FMN-containing dehydrogenase